MLEKNQVITLEIVDISNDGNGIGRYDGLAVFVPMAAVGDVCEVKILKVLSSYCFGKIDKILTPSKDRVASKCNNFSMCGGCDFWHINYAAEKAAKKNFVKAAFERIGKIDTPVNDTLSCEQPERYRNKAQFPVSNDKNGCATTGFFAQRSHRIIPCEDCLLQPVLLNRVAQALISLFNKYKIKAYDESSHLGNIRHIYLRYAQVTDQLMVCIVATSKNIAALDTITREIVAQFPNIKTVVLNINSKDTNIILGQENILLYGDGIITDIICGVKTELSPHSFYQVNHDGAQQLYTLARNMLCLQKDDILLDMYCGAGTIGLSMAQEVYAVVGVEIVHQAIANAIKNAEINDIKNAKFICSDAKDAAEKLYADGFRPTAVVLDPARKGCDTETLNAIINMSPKRIAMISCNPSTAARDCKFLSENGYEIIEIQPYDMFPRTKHVECVVLMTRTSK
ncbi:MAG: 23S rRNA (uracil(1939)-C(5))-methyltransferase RlmD [Oscillospiraceae bacterium]